MTAIAMCCGKIRYVDKRAAKTVLNHILRRRRRYGGSQPVRVYQCPDCQGWHLTSKVRLPDRPRKRRLVGRHHLSGSAARERTAVGEARREADSGEVSSDMRDK